MLKNQHPLSKLWHNSALVVIIIIIIIRSVLFSLLATGIGSRELLLWHDGHLLKNTPFPRREAHQKHESHITNRTLSIISIDIATIIVLRSN